MAGIDKIYLKTKREFIQFYEWCEMFDDFCIKETNDSILDRFYYRPHMIEDNQTEYIATNTSCKIDHFAGEKMCKHDKYLGKRVKRGLFKSSTGMIINADINGAIGILRKVADEKFK